MMKVVDIINTLNEYGIEPIAVDPVADKEEAKQEYGIDIVDIESVKDADCLVFAVAHDEFRKMSWEQINKLFINVDNSEKIIIDVKSIFDKVEIIKKRYSYWRL